MERERRVLLYHTWTLIFYFDFILFLSIFLDLIFLFVLVSWMMKRYVTMVT